MDKEGHEMMINEMPQKFMDIVHRYYHLYHSLCHKFQCFKVLIFGLVFEPTSPNFV